MPTRKKAAPVQHSTELIEAFKNAHEQFQQLIALRPWEIVDESVLLGVQHPDTGDMYYAYFMGELGEVVGLNMYDAENVALWRHSQEELQADPESFSPQTLLTQTFLQFTAERKSVLDKSLVALHEAAGIKIPRGASGYTDAVSYIAGYTPVLPEPQQLQLAATLMPGFIHLIEGILEGAAENLPELDDEDYDLVAIRTGVSGWKIEARLLPEPVTPTFLNADPGAPDAWETLKSLPRVDDTFVFHADLLPAPFGDESGRGIFPVLLLCMSVGSEMILSFQHTPAPKWKTDAASELSHLLSRIGKLPNAFTVADGPLHELIMSCGLALKIPVRADDNAIAMADYAFNAVSTQIQ